MEHDDHDELLRCRERLHGLETKVVALELFLADFREWRAEMRLQVQQNTKRLDSLVKADEVAEAVAQRMQKDTRFGLTLVQKAAAFVVAALVLADSIKGLVS